MRACVVLVLLCAADAAARPYRPVPYPRTHYVSAEQIEADLTQAIRKRNVGAIVKLLDSSVTYDGAWFPDAACTKKFAGTGELERGDVTAFARCLSRVELIATTRKPSGARSVLITYAPGIELELGMSAASKLSWFGAPGTGGTGKPALTTQAFEELRTAGSTNVDDKVRSEIEQQVGTARATATAWFKVCIDATGKVESAAAQEGSSDKTIAAFATAISDWSFRPFKHRGTAIPACALLLLTYPADVAPAMEIIPARSEPRVARDRDADDDDSLVEGVVDGVEGGEEGGVVGGVIGGIGGSPPPPPPPPPPPARLNVPPTLLESYRIAGTKAIRPDAATKRAIDKAGNRVVGSFKLCVDARGMIATVSRLKSTGHAAYDTKIEREMRRWRYRPYFVNGKAVAVCTAVTFIYSP